MSTGVLFISTLVLMTAAQDLLYSFTSQERNLVDSSGDDTYNIFGDNFIEYEYTTSKPSDEVTTSSKADIDDNFKEENLIEYTTSQPRLKLNPSSHILDFDDWDLINEGETAYEVFNQTILNEMTAGNFRPEGTTAGPPSRFTMQSILLNLDDNLFESEEDTTSTIKKPDTGETAYEVFNQTILNEMTAGNFRPEGTTAEPPSRFTMQSILLNLDDNMFESEEDITSTTKKPDTTPSILLDLDDSMFEVESKEATSATVKPVITPKPIVLDIDDSMFENENPEPAPTNPTSIDTATATTSGFDSDEDGNTSDEYLTDINPVTDADYDVEEARKDPCNYEKFEHPIPPIVKTGRRVSDIKCEEYMWDYKINIVDVETKRKECKENMMRQKLIPSEIFGGIKAVQGDFPHMGAVGWIRNDGEVKWMCGSTLISPRFSLTAAHCRNISTSTSQTLNLRFTDPKVVRFGSVYLKDLANRIKNLTVEDVLIQSFMVLEEYAKYPIKKYNDIALIRLATEVKFKLFIKPACLWHGFVGASWSANVTGWGKTTEDEGSESSHLMYAELDFVDHETCKRYVRGRINRHWSEGLKDHQFCAGKLRGGIDACQGDSGGPLQILDTVPAALNSSDVVHHVVGVTSFGIKCGYPLLPGVYTNVTSFMCWIEKNVWPEERNDFCP